MRIPKYVIDAMKRSRYEFDMFHNDENFAAGYTIRVPKYSAMQHIDTFSSEISRIVAWANRIAPESAYILHIPSETHYFMQSAIITIFDPVMKHIEQHIRS